MPHPAFKFKPLGKTARQIPLSQYNGVGKIAQRVSGVGIDGFSSEDQETLRNALRHPERLVKVLDSATAEAIVLHRNGSGGWSETDGHKLIIAAADGEVYPKGTRLWVKWHRQGGAWAALRIPDVRFELKGDLPKDGAAEAYLVELDGGSLEINPDVVITVSDGISTIHGAEGVRGYAHWAGDVSWYEVHQLGCP